MRADWENTTLDEFLNIAGSALANLLPALHMHISSNIRSGIDFIFSKTPASVNHVDNKKLAHYALLSLTMSATCALLHHSTPLLACVAIGGLLGALIQGAPHCKQQIDIEKLYPKSAAAVGFFHGSVCALSNAALFYLLGNNLPVAAASIIVHAKAMRTFMCANEDWALERLNQHYPPSNSSDADKEASRCQHCR
jgi:hypothetical protein